MNKLRQAARQLLRSLESGMIDINNVTALREALAGVNMSPTEQAEQEPIAWTNYNGAVNNRLKAEPVKQEPVAWTNYNGAVNNRLKAAPVDAKAIRAEALEEAAKVCETEAKEWEQAYLWDEEYAVKNCAAAIRGLK